MSSTQLTRPCMIPTSPPYLNCPSPQPVTPAASHSNLSLTLHISVMFDSSFWRVYFSLSYLKVFAYAVPFPRTLFSLPLSGIRMLILQVCGINKDQPNEKKQRLFIHSLLWQGSQPPSLEFWQSFKSRQMSGKALYWEKGRLQVQPDWRLLVWEFYRWDK